MSQRSPDLTGHQSAAAMLPALVITARLVWLACVLAGRALRLFARGLVGATRLTGRLIHRVVAPASAKSAARARWYRRTWPAMATRVGLVTATPARTWVPSLVDVHIGEHVDELLIRPLGGHHAGHWAPYMPALALAYGVPQCRVATAPDNAHLRFEIVRGDPLATPVLPVVDQRYLFEALPIGMREDGSQWCVTGPSILVAGTTGSGKGSVLWSIAWALAPWVPAGMVEFYVIDPKYGVELRRGRPLWHRYADDDLESMVAVLEDAVVAMEARGHRQDTRSWVPSTDAPLIVVIVDELSDLTNLKGQEKALGERADAALRALLRKGRALGVWVIAALQDPRAEAVPFRSLFHSTIGLRLRESGHVDMVMGAGARAQGALCDQIDPDLPGVAYAIEGGSRPFRARASHIPDHYIAGMVQAHGSARHLSAITTTEAA